MTDEERQRQMDFILNQQAQFASDIQQLRETQAQTEQVVNRLANAMLSNFERRDEKFSEVSEDTDRKIAALVDSQMKTEENIRNLTAVVDRYFSEGRNGK
jgi:hypothetical protein